jgi:hypothetical protein
LEIDRSNLGSLTLAPSDGNPHLTYIYPILNVYINERRNKEYCIVKVVLNARERDHADTDMLQASRET